MSRIQLRNSPEVSPEQLARRLAEEFNHYDDPDQPYHQPLINVDQPGDRAHLLVIWDAWRAMRQEERSRLIMDAYGTALGREAALSVSVAMGLTRDEATRLGFDFVPTPA